ncbi:MAG: hypothetical protein KDE19_09755 [Caldilineaceae bacterium]|nr:hypothetical protein [Caldilineaceae bacterium]
MAHGVETGRFGAWLVEQVAIAKPDAGYRIFFDHYQSASPDGGEPVAVAIKGFYGQQVSNANRLADVDIAIVDSNNQVKILIEIEERSSSPKKIVGDVFAVAMCNRVEVKLGNQSRLFSITPETVLFVAGIINPKGNKLSQLHDLIHPRIQKFSSPPDGLSLTNVKFLFKQSIDSTIAELKTSVLAQLQFD